MFFAFYGDRIKGRNEKMKKKKVAILVVVTVTLILIAIVLIHSCDSLTGWAVGEQRSCDCKGIEWVLFDKLSVDGDRKSICIGFVESSECYEYENNERVEVSCQ